MIATVQIPIDSTLDAAADRLGAAMGVLWFLPEETGRFEEVPAYVAQFNEMEFVLFGIPEGEDGDVFLLEMFARSELPLDEVRNSSLPFVAEFLSNKERNERGFFDYSVELAKALAAVGIPASDAQ